MAYTINMTTIDDYIAAQPPALQELLQKVRNAIRETAPQAVETISYGIPTFDINGKHLVHFGAGKHHIGFYGTPSAHNAFQEELAKYKHAKGSVQFPLDEPIPYDLIKTMVKYRIDEVTT